MNSNPHLPKFKLWIINFGMLNYWAHFFFLYLKWENNEVEIQDSSECSRIFLHFLLLWG